MKGYLCVAWAVVFGAVAAWGADPRNGAPTWANPIVAGVIAAAVGYRGARYFKRASHGRLTLDDLDGDGRAPILLLRPFAYDNTFGSGTRPFQPYMPSTWKKVLNPHAVWLSWRALFAMRLTLEQVLEFSTRKVGPLVAIGQPGALPVLGAYNLFVADDWKDAVADLASRSQLVVLVAGSTPALRWEVHFMLAALPPEKCLIFVPPGAFQRWWRTGKKRDPEVHHFPPPGPPLLPFRSVTCARFS